MRRVIVLAGLMALAACSTASQSAPPAQPQPPSESPSTDACNARAYQRLVGRPRSEIPVPTNPRLQRVACASCPITMDYNPERLNFFFDAASGIIKEVRCG